jgi:hypothetical protein
MLNQTAVGPSMPCLPFGVPWTAMDQTLGLATLIASLSLLCSVGRGLEFGSPPTTALTFSSFLALLLGFGTTVVSLGWWGIDVLAAPSSDVV